MPDLFADFNGLPKGVDKTEFYRHDQNWSNRLILGDGLQVMASLAEREGLRGKVQCIYIDPPYGIRFNSNFQWSTSTRDVKDGNVAQITREPEQVKAFRDTWRDGTHSYLGYLRDRITAGRDLLAESGSIFIQISDANVHLVRSILDEVFGDENFIALITVEKTSSQTQEYLPPVTDYLLFYAKNRHALKYRPVWRARSSEQAGASEYSRVQLTTLVRRRMTAEEFLDPLLVAPGGRVYRQDNLTSQSVGREKGEGASSWFPVKVNGDTFRPSIQNRWKTNEEGMCYGIAVYNASRKGTGISHGRCTRV